MSVSFQDSTLPHGLGDQPYSHEVRWCTSSLSESFLGILPQVAAEGQGDRAVGLIPFQLSSLLVGESNLGKGRVVAFRA